LVINIGEETLAKCLYKATKFTYGPAFYAVLEFYTTRNNRSLLNLLLNEPYEAYKVLKDFLGCESGVEIFLESVAKTVSSKNIDSNDIEYLVEALKVGDKKVVTKIIQEIFLPEEYISSVGLRI